jgi:hypothetical protein
MGMQADPRKRGRIHVEEIEEDERFQQLTQVAWAHQPRDLTVTIPSSPTNDFFSAARRSV